MDNEQWKKLRGIFTKIDFFPTHNFEEMKEYRLKEIGKRKAIEFFQEMKKNGNEPTQSDFDFFEIEFLKNELSLIDEKIKDVSISDKLQLEKYRNHIELLLSEGTESDKLSLKQIALLYIYRNEFINYDNADEIVKKYKWKSAKKLIQYYNKYQNTTDRKGDEGSKVKNQNKINDIKKIIPLLNESQQKQAKDEIHTLKIIVENQSI